MDETIQAQLRESMASMSTVNSSDLLHDLRPLLVVHKDGHVQRFLGTAPLVPAGLDPLTGVESKDVVVSTQTGVYVRLYKPPPGLNNQKLPLLVYFHGGGFCIESTASPLYQTYLNSLCSKAGVIIASVEYRLAPEFPLPTAYEDCWAAIEFVAGYVSGEPWLRDYVDCSRVFFAGDSAGGNITYNMAKQIKKKPLQDFNLKGVVLFHPYFWGEERVGSEGQEMNEDSLLSKVWRFACPGTSGLDDPRLNPAEDPEVGGDRVLVAVAEKDALRDRGVFYKETLEKSGWGGKVEVVETPGEDHVFHLMKPSSVAAAELMDRVVQFLNSQ